MTPAARVRALATIVITGACIAFVGTSAVGYDGDADIREGWTFKICGVEAAGLKMLPMQRCPDHLCPTVGSLRDGDLVFPLETDQGSSLVLATPIDEFKVFLNMDEHKEVEGYVMKRYLCKAAPPSRAPVFKDRR